jgi:hypothetical protein
MSDQHNVVIANEVRLVDACVWKTRGGRHVSPSSCHAGNSSVSKPGNV